MFKVGDKVRCIGIAGNSRIKKGCIYTVKRFFDHSSTTMVVSSDEIVFTNAFELVEPSIHMPLYSTEEAIKWLEKEGFTVTPPPEPLKGKVYIYKNAHGDVHIMSINYGQMYRSVAGECNLIAIVDWTEGDGL